MLFSVFLLIARVCYNFQIEIGDVVIGNNSTGNVFTNLC